MPKQISQDELDNVLQAIADFSEGARLEEISQALGGNVPRRTLQRRLALLVAQKRVTASGKSRATRYRAVKSFGKGIGILPALRMEAQGEIYVPLSHAGAEIKEAVRQPI
jgi:hypothetical protein